MVVASVFWCCEGEFLHQIFHPELTEEFSRHDEQIWRCFCTIAGVARGTIPQFFETSDVLATRSRRSGVEECDDVAPCRTLGQLGRHHQDGS